TGQTLSGPDGPRLLDAAHAYGMRLRVAEPPLHELVLVDQRTALVRWDAADTGVAAQGHAVLRTLHALFGCAWDSAIPAVDYRRLTERVRDGLAPQILGLLKAGYKDDAAARQLGLSVRTYRRHVAEIMRTLGASSRFQAGARAAELGLPSPRTG
ncbi:MAG: response regulator transcription factor, partial [Micromonosporaceae bacterium]